MATADGVLNYCLHDVVNLNSKNKISYFMVNNYPKFIVQNIRSSSKNIDNFFATLSAYSLDFNLIGLVETWSIFGNNFKKPGYNLFEHSSNMNKSSGVALYVAEVYNTVIIDLPWINSVSFKIDYLFVKSDIITVNNLPVRVGVLYRSPATNISQFLDFWQKLLDYFCINNLPVIILADLNINILSACDKNVLLFLEKTHNNGFYILNNYSTRVTKSSSSLLDVMITNLNINSSSVIDTNIADHFAVGSLFLFF